MVSVGQASVHGTLQFNCVGPQDQATLDACRNATQTLRIDDGYGWQPARSSESWVSSATGKFASAVSGVLVLIGFVWLYSWWHAERRF